MNKWSEQYQDPSMEELLEALPAEARKAMETLREWVHGSLGGVGRLTYYDVAWRWCETYELRPEGSDLLQTVHLIPDPESPRVALSCQRHFFEQQPLPAIHKSLQSGLGDAVCVGSLAWCCWGMNAPETAAALQELLEQMSPSSVPKL
ncbi:unnamed protein product [Laminaria digitata]